MSLKAKLEAVIYAAEEPVTLAQLAVLFAADAFEYKAELEAAAEAAAETGVATPETLPLLEDELASLGVPADAVSELPADPGPALEESAPAPEAAAEPAESATAPEPSTEVVSEAAEAESAPPAEATEPDAKALARQRDREVRTILRKVLDEIIADYAIDGRGVEIREIAGGYRMATKPECHDAVRLFIKSLKPPLKLSLPALETLAVIAYKQPVTAPEVNDIRGVDSSGVFGSLLSRKLITTAGRKQVIGRPILYKTTKEFLLRFGLKDLAELPSMEEFEKIAAVELSEPGSEEETASDDAAAFTSAEAAADEDAAVLAAAEASAEDAQLLEDAAALEEPAPSDPAAAPAAAEPTEPAAEAASPAPAESAPPAEEETEAIAHGEQEEGR